MSSFLRNRMMGRFISPGEERQRDPPQQGQSQPSPHQARAVKSEAVPKRDDQTVIHVSNGLYSKLDPNVKQWWEKLEEKQAQEKAAAERYYSRPTWTSRYGDQDHHNHEHNTKPKYAGRSASVSAGSAGRNDNEIKPVDKQRGRKFRKTQWTQSQKEKKHNATQGQGPKEPEIFVFSSKKVNVDSIIDNRRASGLEKIDPNYKAYLVSLTHSYEKEYDGRDESWDD